MVNTRCSVSFEIGTPSHLGSDVQEEGSQHSHEETSEMPQESSLQGGSLESETRVDQMERIMESMITLMQGTQLTGQTVPRAPNAIDRFQ